MADDKLQWAFDLVDKMSGPASKMEKAVLRVEKALEGGGKAVLTFQSKVKGANADVGGLKNTFAGFGGPWGTFVGGLQFAANVLADVAWGFGEAAIKAMAFRESTTLSFKAMTGSSKQASELFQRSVVMADITPFATKDVVNQTRAIMGAGFRGKAAENVFAALSDVASISGGGGEAMTGMLTQIAQAKGIGKFMAGDLKIIMSYAGQAGLSLEKLYAQIAEQEKISKASVPGALASGAVSFDSGLFALMKVIERDVSGGKLGSRTLDQGLSLTGLLSTAESLPEKALMGLNSDSAGGVGLRRFLDVFINTVNTSVSEGGRLNKLLVQVADDFGVWLGGIASSGTLQRFFDVLVTGLEVGYQMFGYVSSAVAAFWAELKPAIESSSTFQKLFGEEGKTGVENFGSALGFVAIMLGKAAAGLVWLLDAPLKLMELSTTIKETFAEKGYSIGLALAQGLGKGLIAGVGGAGLTSALDLLGRVVPEKVKGLLEIKSPSRVMERIGEQTVEGFQRGLDAPQADALVAGVTAQARAALPATSREVNVTVTMPITVNAAAADAEGVARQLQETLQTELSLLFRRLASEVGQ